MKRIFFIVIVTLCGLSVNAQPVETNPSNTIATDTLVQPQSLINDFYANQTSMARSYDYELINKKKKFTKWGKDINNLAFGFAMGMGVFCGILADKYHISHWDLAWYIPSCAAVIGGGFYGLIMLERSYERKAEAIQVAPVASYEVGGGVSLQALTLSDRNRRENFGLGIGVTAKF